MQEKFLELLEKRGYHSINSFAKDFGMESQNIYSIVNGHRPLSMNNAFRLAEFFKVPFMDIMEIFYHDRLMNIPIEPLNNP